MRSVPVAPLLACMCSCRVCINFVCASTPISNELRASPLLRKNMRSVASESRNRTQRFGITKAQLQRRPSINPRGHKECKISTKARATVVRVHAHRAYVLLKEITGMCFEMPSQGSDTARGVCMGREPEGVAENTYHSSLPGRSHISPSHTLCSLEYC
jgi:hypothetical protein